MNLRTRDQFAYTNCGSLLISCKWLPFKSPLTEIRHESEILDAFFNNFTPRFEGAREFALQYSFIAMRSGNGVNVDIALRYFTFEAEAVCHASLYEFESGCVLRTCSAEDLIIHKAIGGRPQDLADMYGIVNRQIRKLDVQYIQHWLQILAEVKKDSNLSRPFKEALKNAESLAKRKKSQ
jgi:hypothetical protein